MGCSATSAAAGKKAPVKKKSAPAPAKKAPAPKPAKPAKKEEPAKDSKVYWSKCGLLGFFAITPRMLTNRVRIPS